MHVQYTRTHAIPNGVRIPHYSGENVKRHTKLFDVR